MTPSTPTTPQDLSNDLQKYFEGDYGGGIKVENEHMDCTSDIVKKVELEY